MAEITVSLREFKRLVSDKNPTTIFESADAVAMPLGSHLVRAFKTRRTRIFNGKRTVRMIAIGYSGISSWTMSPLRDDRRER